MHWTDVRGSRAVHDIVTAYVQTYEPLFTIFLSGMWGTWLAAPAVIVGLSRWWLLGVNGTQTKASEKALSRQGGFVNAKWELESEVG